jgi:phosphatidylglycerophosphatase A
MEMLSHWMLEVISTFNEGHSYARQAFMVNETPNNLAQQVWHNPLFFIAFGFGSGLMPIAPGTWGTLVAMPLYFLLAKTSWLVYLAVVSVLFLLCVFICDRVSHQLGVHDHGGIVCDEIVGYLLTMFLAPKGFIWMLLGFVLFRVFDIWKPQPIRWVDKQVQGGLGIMLDDVLAAIPAWIILQCLAWSLQ